MNKNTKHKKHKININNYTYLTNTNKNTRRMRSKNKNKFRVSIKNKKKINCSPKPKHEINDFSCYTNKDIIKLKEHWNARHPDVQITTNNNKEIHDQLSEHLKDICNNEACWLNQKTVFGKLEGGLADSFAPESPPEWKKNPNEWLSSTDILKVMKQYERAYKCFDFIGPTPIDFDTLELGGECVWDELCNFNLEKQIKLGKSKIGIIFNTDPHNKPGQHWISMFVNIKKQTIFFFDSTGDKCPKEINVLINRIKKQGLSMIPKINFKIDSNAGVEHQYGNTECGIYSLYFIIHMLEDKMTEYYLKTHIIKDKYIEQFRHIYFNDSL